MITSVYVRMDCLEVLINPFMVIDVCLVRCVRRVLHLNILNVAQVVWMSVQIATNYVPLPYVYSLTPPIYPISP